MSGNFPGEIMQEILLKLPIKSIVRFTSVCKSWNSLIRNPSFISTHLNQTISSTKHSLFLLRFSYKEEHFSLHFDDDEFKEFMQLDNYPLKGIDKYFSLIGSCNGLTCLADCLYPQSNAFILWNPSISKFKTLPKPNVSFETHGEYNANIGFGFDSCANDYKVLRIVELANDDEPVIELYSLAADYWKILNTEVLKYGIVTSCSQAFVNGVVHFIAYHRNKHGRTCKFWVLGFDISREVFREIILPESFAEEIRSVLVFKESTIALFTTSYYYPVKFHLWVMKKYGVAGSWIKLLSLGNQLKAIPRAFGFRKSGELVLQFHGGELASYDGESQQMKSLRIHQKPGNYFFYSYVQSLVLFDKANYEQ